MFTDKKYLLHKIEILEGKLQSRTELYEMYRDLALRLLLEKRAAEETVSPKITEDKHKVKIEMTAEEFDELMKILEGVL